MTVQKIRLPGRHFQVTGTGYAPEGGFSEEGQVVDPDRDGELVNLLRAALMCSNA